MISVVQENNLFLIYSKNFFFFIWKFEESQISPGCTTRSSEFELVKGETSFLEMKIDSVFYINLWNPSTSVRRGHFTILISDENGSIIHSKNVPTNYFIEAGNKVDLLKSLFDVPPSVKYPITITCISKDWNTDEKSVSSKDSILLNNLRELSLDFRKVLEQAIYSNIVLNVDGDNIKAHKIILQARSPVFHKMFTHETAVNPIVISDIGPETMKRLLNFLYTGTTDECGFEELLELYYAADKYEVISLRDSCKMELLNFLQVNNACYLFVLANRHSDEVFKNEVVQFISANFKSVVETESFDELGKDDMKLLMRLCADAMNE
ncbi:speckle-type POZ protein B isoform X2 [Parasteatoda tepidariorum]|uniref:speckle-type POZ protein B isoform X2 n=1 Tax=Parasteatoda tepidariorum TaxID=114398 RepID=UPI001C727D57|nr:speckle-type POZ protein B isoform X2 [Parasteatoda tepidariorum]XP_042907725.1 speckle-type POZ protein B isoform X2 [Parasteatoda tepidariorum]XP_042907726.1 speckle-type POZ protein B isoform X2 [Parasteatoda tepidariorum]